MKTVYKYYEDFGRMGKLEGVFIADSEEMKKHSTNTAYFGEVLGKHSNVCSDKWFNNTTEVTTVTLLIDIIEKYDLTSGLNPLEYTWEEDDG